MILGQSYDMTYDNLTRNLKIVCKLGPWLVALRYYFGWRCHWEKERNKKEMATCQLGYEIIDSSSSFDKQHHTPWLLQLTDHFRQWLCSNHSCPFSFIGKELVHFLHCPIECTDLNICTCDLQAFISSSLLENSSSCNRCRFFRMIP